MLPEPMAFAPGTSLGPYEIQSALGAGSMGEVYKARDSRLDRTVAIKVLPEHVAADPELKHRFEREARALAALSHPHICPVFDVGRQAPSTGSGQAVEFLVMEYLEGETLEQRLTRGALPLDQALRLAIQVADALAAAHRAGIVHRDLKPGNIMLTRTGATLLDFGLAKTGAPVGAGRASMLPTMPPRQTQPGAILGTFQYMAPEQLEGQEADARTDLFAFGALVYEMVTGRKAFEGTSQASLIAAILEREPPAMSTLQPPLPSALDRVVRKCVRKDPEDRWQTARDLLDELRWVAEGGAVAAPGDNPARRGWREPAAWIAAAAGVAAAGFLALQPTTGLPSSSAIARLSVLPPDGTSFTAQSAASVGIPQFELSPDGRAIVFAVAERGGRPSLWLRPLDSVVARALPGTEGAEFPFWSPDSRWVGFFADGRLKKVPIAGGPPQPIASDLPDYRPAAWGPDDTILLSRGYTGILRVAASGGTVTRVTELDASRQEGSHRYPQFLPDGRHFLFQIRSSRAEHTGVYVGAFDDATKRLLIRGQTTARYASGNLFFLDGDILMRRPFDTGRLELTGEAVPVGEGVGRSSMGTGAYSLSTAGTLAYAGTLRTPSRLTWFDRDGDPVGTVGVVGDYTDFRLDPDGTRLAASLVDGKTGFPDIWLTDLARGSTSRFTFGPAVNAGALWSRDGTRIVFRTTRSGGLQEFYTKSAGGGGSEEPVVPQSGMRVVTSNATLSDWSPDGGYLLFPAVGSSDWDLWVVSLAQGARPAPYLTAPGDQWHGNFSPDGRLVAYSSTESGRFEVYVQGFPLSDRQWPISTGGGYEPRWRADGREIYYLSADRKLMAVAVGAGPSFGPPTPLFQTGVAPGVHSQRTRYVPSRDGRRFLISTPVAEQAPTPITVVLNVAGR